MSQKYIHKSDCRICGSQKLVKILDLGTMPSANSFLYKKEINLPEEEFPLAVSFCPNCSLVQLCDVVDPKFLYTHYDYTSSASRPLVEYLQDLGLALHKRFINSKSDLFLEIGGNDGALLEAVKDKCRVVNIEPAGKIARISRSKGIETINNFFSSAVAREVLETHGPASVVTANNVIAHIDNLQDLLLGINTLIGDKGIFQCDVHWVGNLIGDGGFDQIYHEHFSYFSLLAFKRLAEANGLKIFDAQIMPMHGQLLRLFMAKNRPVARSVANIIAKEKKIGIDKLKTYRAFAKKVETNRNKLKTLLIGLKKQGKTIVGYGAPAKGNTLLNSCGIDSRHIDFLVDTTPFKQGLYTPGGHIPVRNPIHFKKTKPDYAVLLAWNYADVILKNESEYRRTGGRFIIPVPRPKIV